MAEMDESPYKHKTKYGLLCEHNLSEEEGCGECESQSDLLRAYAEDLVREYKEDGPQFGFVLQGFIEMALGGPFDWDSVKAQKSGKLSAKTFIGWPDVMQVGDEFHADGQEWMVVTVRHSGAIAIVFARCLGCWDCVFPGVRWPTASNGDNSQDWIERCDYCETYDSDIDAAVAVALGTGRPIHIGRAVGRDRPGPYIEYKEGGE